MGKYFVSVVAEKTTPWPAGEFFAMAGIDDDASHPYGRWSVRLLFLAGRDLSPAPIATLEFISPSAPTVSVGAKLRLFSGPHSLAQAIVRVAVETPASSLGRDVDFRTANTIVPWREAA